MAEWVVRRWARFGHDRLYAATPGGTDLGYLDQKTGRFHADDMANLPLLRKAIEEHQVARRQLHPVGGPPEARQPPPPVSPTSEPPVMNGWHDLAEVRAGAAARERAVAKRVEQGPFRHVLARVLGAKTDERAWRIGADGEEAVARELATLDHRWKILHAVRVGDRGADIDHLLIGPGGVFTINTKNHPQAAVWVGGDTVMLDGRRVPYVRNSRHEARRASRLLTDHVGFPVTATGLIAVVGARRGLTVRSQPADGAVVVVPGRKLAGFARSQAPRLGFREIQAIHETARRSTTWQR